MSGPSDGAIEHYHLTDHARQQMARRGISEAKVDQVLRAPEQVLEVRPGRVVYQARMDAENAEIVYLLRVFVDVDRSPPDVVTVYRTSKIAKYWRDEV